MTFFDYAGTGVIWSGLDGLSLNFLLICGRRKHVNLLGYFCCISDMPFGIANKCDTGDGESQSGIYFSFVCSQWPVLLLRCLLRVGHRIEKLIMNEVKVCVVVDVGFF